MAVLAPIPVLGSKALAIGHLNSYPDVDGAIRTEPLVVNYYNQYYPSLSLMLAAKSLNLGPQDIHINLGEGVQLGNLKIATDPALRMHTYFYKDRDGHPAFPVDSFYDVLTGKIPADKYRDKIVLIGASAAGIGSLQVTPVSSGMAPVVTLANSVSSILKGDFFVTPDWAGLAQIGVFLLVTLYLVLLLPRLTAAIGAAVTGTIVCGADCYPFRADDDAGNVAATDAARLAVAGWPFAADDQTLPDDRKKQTEIGCRIGGE